MTQQKLYAILRKAGYRAAKWEASGMVRGWGEYSTGPRITKRDNVLRVTYETGRTRGDSAAANAMKHYIVPALEAAGVKGEWVDQICYDISVS
jgi:hypothetical protein